MLLAVFSETLLSSLEISSPFCVVSAILHILLPWYKSPAIFADSDDPA